MHSALWPAGCGRLVTSYVIWGRSMMGHKHALEQAHSVGDFFGRSTSKTQDEPLTRRLNQVVGGKRPEPEFLPCCMPCNLHITKSSGKDNEKIRPGFSPQHFQGSPDLLPHPFDN